ncbi:hypothetical protein KMZ29_24020 [Bradyrhizobium sediminis]|uniref:Uncharacterized protein n=1 Tax=Bradyrhizobium sediminis TaxID=2840469 RepID=A0A975RMH6_9BRAD|nr:hypothetical protein KMZ29_24020 [Bradyrhizobium sediminis]
MSDVSSTADGPACRTSSTGGPLAMMAVLWGTVVIALAAPATTTGVFDAMSTDDAMRLVELRDLIAGQGWFDLVQHRLNPPGVLMHWSRAIDAPLSALILILRPLAGTHGAEAITLALWPALLFGAILLLAAAIAKRMSDGGAQPKTQLATALLTALSVPALVHFRAGAIDHHNAQIVLMFAFVLLATEIERSAVKACLAGVTASLSLAIGLEMLPAIAAACVAIFGLLIWRGDSVSRPVSIFGGALAGSSLLLASVLLPIHSLTAPACDAFGGPFLLLIAGGGVSLVAVAYVNRLHPTLGGRLAAAAVAGGALLGSFFELFPGCIASPYAQVAPLLTEFWLDRVAETMSFQKVLQYTPQKILGFYGFPLITLGLAVVALIRCAPPARFPWIVSIVTLAALIGTSLWEVRGAAAANMVAAPFCAVSLAGLWANRAQGRQLVLAALIVSPASLGAIGLAARPLIERILMPQFTIAAMDSTASCQTVSSVASLAGLPPGRVMAPIDLGPAILAATGHTVFAAPYHRNNDGNLAMVNAMLSAPEAAQRILSDRQVDYVVICAASPDQKDFVKSAPDGLAARLGRGETPDFLQPLDLDPTRKLTAWRVRE